MAEGICDHEHWVCEVGCCVRLFCCYHLFVDSEMWFAVKGQVLEKKVSRSFMSVSTGFGAKTNRPNDGNRSYTMLRFVPGGFDQRNKTLCGKQAHMYKRGLFSGRYGNSYYCNVA